MHGNKHPCSRYIAEDEAARQTICPDEPRLRWGVGDNRLPLYGATSPMDAAMYGWNQT